MTRVILASNSQSRKMLMDSLGIVYESIPADIDEKAIRDSDLKVQAEKIARGKAEFVAQKCEGIVIAADTFGSINGKILEKPKNLEEAKEMLRLQSGKEGVMYTGFCYIDKKNNINFSDTAVIKYTFRDLFEEEIAYFVENNPVTQWSAAFSPNDPYQTGFISKIEGSLTALIYGIPVELLIPLLGKSRVKLFTKN